MKPHTPLMAPVVRAEGSNSASAVQVWEAAAGRCTLAGAASTNLRALQSDALLPLTKDGHVRRVLLICASEHCTCPPAALQLPEN